MVAHKLTTRVVLTLAAYLIVLLGYINVSHATPNGVVVSPNHGGPPLRTQPLKNGGHVKIYAEYEELYSPDGIWQESLNRHTGELIKPVYDSQGKLISLNTVKPREGHTPRHIKKINTSRKNGTQTSNPNIRKISSVFTEPDLFTFSRDSKNNPIGPANRLVGDAGYTYDYDDEGNLIKKTEKSSGSWTEYQYNHRNLLTRVSTYLSDGTVARGVAYKYDSKNNRIRREIFNSLGTVINALNTQYAQGHPWADFDDNGNQVARYLPGVNPNDPPLAREIVATGEIETYLLDEQNSVVAKTDLQGNIINETEYGAFGNIIGETNPEKGDRFKWHGIPYDPESEIYLTKMRAYDPFAGRFIQEDPIGFLGEDSNLYRYGYNSPLKFMDPRGESPLIEQDVIEDALAKNAAPTAAEVGLVQSFVFQYNSAALRYGSTGLYGIVVKNSNKAKRVIGGVGKISREVQTQLRGGLRGAVDFFNRATGQASPRFDTPTHRYILRTDSGKTVTVEVINKVTRVVEKIRFVE